MIQAIKPGVVLLSLREQFSVRSASSQAPKRLWERQPKPRLSAQAQRECAESVVTTGAPGQVLGYTAPQQDVTTLAATTDEILG